MGLPYTTESLDDIPESARELYEETEGGYRLPVEGVKPESEVEGLASALERLKHEREQLRKSQLTDEQREEYERLREEAKAKQEEKLIDEGKLDEIRAKWQEEKQAELERRDKMIHQLAVTSQLQSAIAAAGVLDEYRDDAIRALRDLNPTVKMVDGEPVGVFRDEVKGDKPISEFVSEWASSDAAKKYMPAPKGGGGATGQPGKNIPSSKKWAEMTPEEKVAYTEAKYSG